MRANVYTNGGYGIGGLTSNGGTISGELILVGDPVQPNEAVTKQYLENKANNLSAVNFTTGVLPVGVLPAMTGDATSSPGSNILNLVNSGVASGSYTKVGVDTKGRVISGTGLLESDIPSFSWNKITSGKPTTITGYGITDAVRLSGGVMTGQLNLAGDPLQNLGAVSKGYVDNVFANVGGGLGVGDIIERPTSVTPVGFLKCNGGELSQVTYSALYAVIGGSFGTAGLGNFRLPDYTSYETVNGPFYFIKF